eukprot:NODE_835_length_1298_cov_290.388311_g634_i0.p1 GENE.NODE_835_length_1298_cov_290.388311_g634_i0~~NODE_835_length_1298_cov_290.388311_g634_i0.p1  ORF type:complete len:367 (+),score=46.87 NODE_835_length_1298_cov_290.388311_g634_i0:66-1166(+)
MRKFNLKCDTADEPKPIDTRDYVSLGGSLHLSKGIAVTQKGVKGGGSELLSITVTDLEPVGHFGKGSSGSVKKVKHKITGEVFAVKEIKLGGDRHLDEISKELGTLYGNKEGGRVSPYIIDFKGAYSQDGSVYIALEAMDGSLMDLISPEKGVTENVLACITKSVLRGLTFLHKTLKLVHRDIKPQNLLYRKDGTIKITDFGVCAEIESTKAGANSFVGTVTYMSPERLAGLQYSFSADIWGLGISLVQLATAEHPYAQMTKSQEVESKFWMLITHLQECPAPVLQGSYSAEFKDFVARCLQKDKDARPTSGQLLEHPWIVGNTMEDDCINQATIEKWMKSCVEPSNPSMSQSELDSVLDKLVLGV